MSTSTLDRYSNSSLKSEVFTTSAISQLFRQRSTATDSSVHTPLSVGKKGVTPQLDNVAKSQQTGGRKLVKKGDIVINSRSDRRGASGLSDRDGSVSLIYIVLKPNLEKINPEFAHYLIRSKGFQEEFYRFGTGIVADLWSTRYERMAQIRVPLPPMETQQRIADYLDRETAEIDAAVADLDRYVKLLEKRGKVLIEKTVNGGTNSFSPLWSKIRVQNGFAFDSEKFSPTKELPVAKIGNVLPGDFSEFIDASELPSESFLIKDGDLVVGMSGDFNRTIWNKGKAALNQRVCILKPIADDDIRYINYAIGSGLKKIHSTKFSTTLKNLSTEEILAIRVPHRTVTEQKEIATYLDKETAEINDLVVESTRLRDLLLKRRSVLITEVVTGRKQV